LQVAYIKQLTIFYSYSLRRYGLRIPLPSGSGNEHYISPGEKYLARTGAVYHEAEYTRRGFALPILPYGPGPGFRS